jgi:hypothetical protein
MRARGGAGKPSVGDRAQLERAEAGVSVASNAKSNAQDRKRGRSMIPTYDFVAFSAKSVAFTPAEVRSAPAQCV